MTDFIPKNDTQQSEFLKKYPEFDGRGILIAILDSGVDVSMPGLQKTSTGLPKIIDCIDLTGSGDIDTSTVKETDENNILIGLSGRKLKIPLKWKNPSGKWHLGKKLYHKFYPQMIDKELPKEKEIQRKNEKLYQRIIVKKIYQKYHPIYLDCIVWFDGEKWCACLDGSFSENIENEKVLTDFCDEHEYEIISDKFVYSISIKNEGNLVSVFFPGISHGTTVSQIASAHFPEEPDRNGLAPGAQIILMNIVGATYNLDIVKEALLKCIEMKADIVNLSCGFQKVEPFSDIVNKMINEHGIIVVKAVGNDGPIYSSISDVNYYNDAVLNIGSIITPEIKNKIYDCQKTTDNNTITASLDSSRGPLSTGARGITFCAPIVVRVPTPKWSSKVNAIYDGTSYAAPIITGSIACLLSALKLNAIKYSPAMMKLALSNTAFLPEDGDILEFGNGIIQILDAFEFIKSSLTNISLQSFTPIFLNGPKNIKDGIIFIKKDKTQFSKDYCITVKSFRKNFSWILHSKPNNQQFIKFSKTVKNDKFSVKIDTDSLMPGNLYYTEIHGIHPSKPEIGSQFYLPITVIFPERLNKNDKIQKEIFLQPEKPFRFFFIPSFKSKKCIVQLTAVKEEIKTKVLFQYGNENGAIKSKHLKFNQSTKIQKHSIPIHSNKVAQICICLDDDFKELNALYKFQVDIYCKSMSKIDLNE